MRRTAASAFVRACRSHERTAGSLFRCLVPPCGPVFLRTSAAPRPDDDAARLHASPFVGWRPPPGQRQPPSGRPPPGSASRSSPSSPGQGLMRFRSGSGRSPWTQGSGGRRPCAPCCRAVEVRLPVRAQRPGAGRPRGVRQACCGGLPQNRTEQGGAGHAQHGRTDVEADLVEGLAVRALDELVGLRARGLPSTKCSTRQWGKGTSRRTPSTASGGTLRRSTRRLTRLPFPIRHRCAAPRGSCSAARTRPSPGGVLRRVRHQEVLRLLVVRPGHLFDLHERRTCASSIGCRTVSGPDLGALDREGVAPGTYRGSWRCRSWGAPTPRPGRAGVSEEQVSGEGLDFAGSRFRRSALRGRRPLPSSRRHVGSRPVTGAVR